MRKKIFLAAISFLFLYVFISAQAEDETGLIVEHIDKNRFSCRYDGVKHNFILDLPERTEGAPLVVMLPGYGNTAESFRDTVHFELDANMLGYAVVYVTGARNPNDPLSSVGWNSGIGIDGNDDVSFLVSLAKYLQKEYSFDDSRTFAVGFSNGAFMVHRLAMEAGDIFPACVSVAGLMPAKIWNERRETNDISFFQITGEKDDAIPQTGSGSAKYAKDPAIEDVMSYWAESDGLDLCDREETESGVLLTKCGSKEKPNQVWNLLIPNGRHSWPSVKMNGIDGNDLILEFLESVSVSQKEAENPL